MTSSHEINNGSMVKMGIVKKNGTWVSKDNTSVGVAAKPSGYVDDD